MGKIKKKNPNVTKLKNSNWDNLKLQNVTKLLKLKKKIIYDTKKIQMWQNLKTQSVANLKIWQNSKTQNVTELKKTLDRKKLKNWKCDKIQSVTKLKNSKSDNTQKVKMWQKLLYKHCQLVWLYGTAKPKWLEVMQNTLII